MKSYHISEEELSRVYNTDFLTGLSAHEVKRRKKQFGYNVLPEKGPDSWLAIFVRQFKSPLIFILLIAALIIYFVGPDTFDAFIITGILLFNALIGAVQEGRTSRILAGLKKFIVSDCVVIRGGVAQVIDAAQLVPGDIVLLQEGQRVPADMRLIEASNLHVDEAILTGESLGVRKYPDPISGDSVPLVEQRNMLFKGTYLLAGSGKGVVVATGLRTEVGKIHLSAQEVQTEIPLKKELDTLSGWILFFIVAVCLILLCAGIIAGKPFKELLVTLTALFICVIPEGLPVVLTLVLVSGVHRMARLRVLVKKMQAVETLGRTDVIVIDKTGTLTRNEMMVTHVWADTIHWHITGHGYSAQGSVLNGQQSITQFDEYENLQLVGKACIMLSNAQMSPALEHDRFTIKGDPTEAAMAILGQKLGASKQQLEHDWKKIGEIPFDSKLKYHAVVCRHGDQGIIFVSGAPETLFAWIHELPHRTKEELAIFLSDGLRVVALAYTFVDLAKLEGLDSHRGSIEEIISHELTFLGLCGIQDAIRSEVKDVITETRAAGLRIIMATGDHQKTALYVAKSVGIFHEGDQALDGHSLETLPEQELKRLVPFTTVYSRVSPANKLKLIQLYHEQGHIVAMTGDGVNDVPSFVAADISIAMGGIGTEVAKGVADIVLLDDSFVHIVTAIKEGRHIFYTLRRVILYFFATNMGEVLIMLFAMVYLFINPAFPLPLAAAQILWLNLITDGFLDMAIAMEPYEKGLLNNKMLPNHQHIVDATILTKALLMALPMAMGSLGIFICYYKSNLAYARTMALVCMAMFQWFNAWNCRSERQSIFTLGIFTNHWLIAGTLFVLLLQLIMVYVPCMQLLFNTVALSLHDWLIICAVSSSIVLFEELRKWLVWYRTNQGATLTKG
jgi:Ca2+-transporting ATPase